jgi:hypothetical protein
MMSKRFNLFLFVVNILFLVVNGLFFTFGSHSTTNFIACVFSLFGAMSAWYLYIDADSP